MAATALLSLRVDLGLAGNQVAGRTTDPDMSTHELAGDVEPGAHHARRVPSVMVDRRLETTDMPRSENTAMIPRAVVTDDAPRCWRCRKKLANFASRPWELVCTRCQAVNASAPPRT